jgi:predicted kinase
MAGAPGSGKSAVASAVAAEIGAVVLDSDVVKSAVLDADVPWALAGPAAYGVVFALADDLLRSRSVVIDSPSHYPEIPARGLAIAERRGAAYRFVECVCDDDEELARRLRERTPRRSQMLGVGVPPADAGEAPHPATRTGPHRWRTFGPPGGHLVLETLAPVADCAARALRYALG